ERASEQASELKASQPGCAQTVSILPKRSQADRQTATVASTCQREQFSGETIRCEVRARPVARRRR
uniref:Uncharacterized protein n=1 Tax=Anopheles albimanus TaxID=7167 RepID=A0A182FY96_ANOAL